MRVGAVVTKKAAAAPRARRRTKPQCEFTITGMGFHPLRCVKPDGHAGEHNLQQSA